MQEIKDQMRKQELPQGTIRVEEIIDPKGKPFHNPMSNHLLSWASPFSDIGVPDALRVPQ